MPYIDTARREEIINGLLPETPGDVNFIFSTVCNDYIEEHGLCYATINTLVGVLECTKLELYRRVATNYENQKCMENGEVYTCLSNI